MFNDYYESQDTFSIKIIFMRLESGHIFRGFLFGKQRGKEVGT